MKIESLTLKGFRCFGPDGTTITFEHGVTALVGGNSAGKTALLQELSRLFGVTPSQRRIILRDFHLSPDEAELQSGASLSIDVRLSFPELSGLEEDEIGGEEFRYFRVDRKSRRSSVRSLTLPAGDAEASQYVRLAVRAYPELYFARFVILAEGDSERLVIPRIAEALGISLDPSFVPIAPPWAAVTVHISGDCSRTCRFRMQHGSTLISAARMAAPT